MSCQDCIHLAEIKRIRTPTELESVITIIKSNITDGTLKELPGAQVPLNEIEPYGKWPDLLNHKFICQTCNQKFGLTVETYHGRGGFWDPLD